LKNEKEKQNYMNKKRNRTRILTRRLWRTQSRQTRIM